MRWPRLVAAILAIGAGVAASGPTAAVAPEPPETCGRGSWTAGTVDICNGELVYRDYVYDDHGAAVTPTFEGPAEGLYAGLRVPIDAYGDLPPVGMAELAEASAGRDNTADLVALRLSVRGDRVSVTAELNTMLDAGRARVVVGIDTDDNPATGAAPVWPLGLVASPFLPPSQQGLVNRGLDTFIELDTGDPTSNLLMTTVPRLAGGRWRVQAVVARAVDDESVPVVMNVAFRGPDERGPWWENAQAVALARNDISPFATTVDVSDLTSATTRVAMVEPGLLRQRVYESRYDLGEGLSPPAGPAEKPMQVTAGASMLGRYQPYAFYRPTTDGPHGLQFVLHGMGENHSSLMWDPGGGRNPPPIAVKFGEAHNRIIAVPLGRGPHGWYSSSSERDVLDVLADIVANYPVDADRVVMGGASMGGYGAMRMATLYPDLFAGVVQWVGYTGDAGNGTPLRDNGVSSFGALGNAVDLLGNLRHVPMGALYSGADELVHVNQALAVRDRLAVLEVPSMFWLHPAASHSTYSVDNTWTKEADWSAGLRRVADVAHVTYRTDRRFFAPDLDIAPDHAYWVSAVVPGGDGYADVDAVSHGCGSGDPVTELETSSGTDPVPWQGQEVRAVGVPRRPVANRVDLTLANVTSLIIATDGIAGQRPSWDSCLTAASLAYRIDTDRPVTVSFSDGRRLTLPAGVHEGVLAAALRPSAPAAVPALPATGGRGVALPAVVLLAAALVLRMTTRP